VLDENEVDEDGDKVEEEVLDEGDEKGEEDEESDVVRELLFIHPVWLGL
jgi:hypothetical protein